VIVAGQRPGAYVLCQGDQEIPFSLHLTDRKSLAVEVHPDLRVVARAPQGASLPRILERINKRRHWIAEQLRFFRDFLPGETPRQFVSGETHCFRGNQYRLRVRKGSAASLKLVGKFFEVQSPDPKNIAITKELMEQWFDKHARALFKSRMTKVLKGCGHLGFQAPPRLAVRTMAKRWGSCTRSGTITLNRDLARVPVTCVDYVLAHELCHLKVHAHTPKFYDLLARCMPDWEARKARLDRWGTR
jgi:predicted metal-dependent hydrolase